MNYKHHKPRKQITCSYYTSNRIGYSERTKDLEEEWPSVPAKYPSWYCKKRKGKHEFLFVKEDGSLIFPGKFQTFRCISCGKNRIKPLRSPLLKLLDEVHDRVPSISEKEANEDIEKAIRSVRSLE